MDRYSNLLRDHLRQLLSIQSLLDRYDGAMVRSKFDALIFDSFSFVVLCGDRQLKFEWDGREFFLDLRCAKSTEYVMTKDWQHVTNVRIAPPDFLWQTIEQLLIDQLDAVRG
jgi:hypothetical protein